MTRGRQRLRQREERMKGGRDRETKKDRQNERGEGGFVWGLGRSA